MIKTSRGFTLIEMAIVLIIITILIGGLAVPCRRKFRHGGLRKPKRLWKKRARRSSAMP